MIIYSVTAKISSKQLANLIAHSKSQRPTNDLGRLTRMIRNANLLYSAWDDDRLVGVVRGFSDEVTCCYLSELVVRDDYPQLEISRKLINKIHRELGSGISLVSAVIPDSLATDEKMGFEQIDSGFQLPREY